MTMLERVKKIVREQARELYPDALPDPRLAETVEEFIARGGEIERVPMGLSGRDERGQHRETRWQSRDRLEGVKRGAPTDPVYAPAHDETLGPRLPHAEPGNRRSRRLRSEPKR